jgi:hypothetical protein
VPGERVKQRRNSRFIAENAEKKRREREETAEEETSGGDYMD